jgi:hypothetical protein
MNIDAFRSVYPDVVQAIDRVADDAFAQAKDAPYQGLVDIDAWIAHSKGRVYCTVLNTMRKVAKLKRDEPTPPNLLRMVGKAVWNRVHVLDQLLQ